MTAEIENAAATAQEYFETGRKMLLLFDTEGYLEAVPLFLRGMELEPKNPLIFAALAETYSFWGSRREKNGQDCLSYYDLSYENARKGLELGPELSETHRAMAVALRMGAREGPEQRKREAQRAYELNPYDGENCCELWRASGRLPDDQLIHKALALFPLFCAAHIDLGVSLCEQGRLDEAAFHLNKALAINPRNSLACYDLAMVMLRKGALNEAESLLRRAAEMHPEDCLILSGFELVKSELGASPEII